jgi:hypothetical protein
MYSCVAALNTVDDDKVIRSRVELVKALDWKKRECLTAI